MSFLYFLTDQNHRTRISVSGDPQRRAKDSGHTLAYMFQLNTTDAAMAYKERLQTVFWSVKDGNDWYNVTPQRALTVLHEVRDTDPFNRLPIRKTLVNPEFMKRFVKQ